ncbi:MAG: cupin [Bacteroidota bacterium]|nr:cupin [Bacteroidota bacterium]MDP4192303.1 cupin [Bacteroidota bacterium]MDP4196429.1 cupin [Bacteroidota bacterium]
MAIKISGPSVIKAAGNKPKLIEEYAGKVNTKEDRISIAKMTSPEGWVEPGQTPEFDEYTVVLKGNLRVKTNQEVIELKEKEAILVKKGEWVQYSTPYEGGAEYMAICLPAFSPEAVHRDD